MEMQEELNASEQKETIQIQEKNQEKENKQEEQIELDKEQFIKNEKEYSENRESNNSQENKIKFGNENFDFDIQLKLRKVDSDEFMISPLKGEKLKQKQQQNQEKRRKLRKFSNAVEEIKEREKNKESEENSMNRSQQDLPKYAEKQREKEKKLQKLEISEQDFLLASSQQEYSFQNQFNNQFIQPCIENEIIPDTQIKEEMEDLEEDFDNSDEDSELISKDSLLLDQNDIVIYDSDSEEDQENSSKILKRQDNIQRGNQQEVIVEQEEDFQQQEIQIENQNKEQEQDQNEIQKQENQHINLYDDQKENQQTDQPSNLQGNQEQQKNDGEIVIDNLEQLKEYQKNKEVVKESQEILIKNQFQRKLQKSVSSIGSEQITKQQEQQNQFQIQISSIENEYQSQNNSSISQNIVINNKSKSNSINLNSKNRNKQQNSDQLENSQITSQYKKSGGFYNNNSQNLNLNQKSNKFRKSLTNYTLNLGKILTEGALQNRRRNVSRMKNLDIKGEFKLQYWVELQQKLKQEVNLVEKETEFKDEIMKELKRLNTSYYTNYIELINLEDGVKYDEELKQIDPKQFFQSSSNQSQNLNNNNQNLDRFKKNGHQQIKYVIADEQKVFNFVSMQIQKFLSYLQGNPKVMIFAILNHQTKLSSSQISNLSRAFINTVYDEIIEQNTQKNKLYEFFAQLLKQTVENIEKASDLKLINNSFYGKILRQFLKRYSFKVYLEQVKRVPLWHITRVDSDLRINKIDNIYEEGQKLFRTDPKAYKASISSWQKQNKKQQQQQFRQKKYSESLMYDQEAQLQKPQIEKYEDMMKNMQKKDILNMIEKNQEAQIAQMPGKKTLNQIKISDSFLQQQQQNQQLQQRSESVTLETLGKILDQQENGSVSSTYRQSNPVFQSQQLQQQNSQLLMEEKDSVQSSQNTLFQSQNLKKYLSQQQELENRNQQHNQKQQQQQQQLSINNSMVLKKGNYFLQKSGNNNSNFILNNNNNGNSSSLQRQKSEIYQDLYVQSQLEKRSKKLEQLVHIVMQSIFDHMHNFPNGIKIVLKMVKMLILKKFQDSDSNSINQIFANYIFDIWILPQLQFPQLYIDLKLIKAVHNVNLMEIRKIIQKIFNKSSFTDENYSRYNVIIEQYMESVDKYYEEISNVNEKLIEEIFQKSELIENQIFEKLQTQTICLSVENIQNLINMVYSCKEELGEKFGENGNKLGILEIIKQLHKQCQDKDLKLFESKKNLDSKNVNRVFLPGEIFVLFQNFRLPNECDTNFQQVLNKSYKVNFKDTKENITLEKSKNVLRQLLIQMEDVDNFYNYMGQKGKLSFIDIVELYKQQNYVSLSNSTVKSDQIPGHLKAEYFLSLTKKLQAKYRLNDYRQLYEELRENLRERMENFKDITQKIKVMVLRAKQCLQKKLTINQKIMDRFKQEISRRELYFFIEKARFSFCLTNQEMRSKLPINKKLLEQNYEEQLNGQLIIEEQQSCIHSLVNTKFLNSLAGNLQENDPTKNSHFNSIKEFIKIFSELPEVKNLIKNGDDKFKVNENFNEFISALMDLIKEDEQFEQMQSKDLIWLQDNLEQYITKQIYDKLFPKKSTVKDLSLCIRLQTLDWISYDHLEIDEFNREDSMWEKAAQSLNNIENCRTPTEKLEALQECTNNMADILKLTSKKEEAVGADITTPCMIYILLKAKPQKLPSNLYFINAFANSQSMRTASGFCFTQIRSVMGFLENLQASQLKNISQLQFDRNTYERECQLEISFLKKRPREGRRKIRFDLVKKVQNEQLEIISFKRNSINSQNSQQGQLESQYNLNANNDVQNIKIEDKNINKNENENQKEQIQNNQLEQQKKKENNEKIQEEVNNRNRQKSSALFQRRISQNLNFLNGNLASSEIVSKNQENAKKLLGIEENYNSENEIFSQSQKMQISELIKEKNAQTSNIY